MPSVVRPGPGPKPSPHDQRPPGALATLAAWPARQWLIAAALGVGVFLVVGMPTGVVPTPVFGRPVPVTWWAPWSLAVTAVLGGLVLATWVRTSAPGVSDDERPLRRAGIGGLLAYLAVGCPVCNKLVVAAVGTSGALSWFAPLQPVLAVASVVVLAVALRARLRSLAGCPLP